MRRWVLALLAVTPAGLVACSGKNNGGEARDGAGAPVVKASLVPENGADARPAADAQNRAEDKTAREASHDRGAVDLEASLANNDSPAARAWRLARDKRTKEARQLLEDEIAAGRRTSDVVGTQLAIDLSERSDAELLQKAKGFLAAGQSSFITGTVRLLLSYHQMQLGALAEAARALGADNWFVGSAGGRMQADDIVTAAEKSTTAEEAVLALSSLLDSYTHGALDFEQHRERLTRYHSALQLQLNRLLFDPAGTWHSREYEVRGGDSLIQICKRFATLDAGALRLEPGLLRLVNRMKNDRVLKSQRLRIPVDPFRTVVEKRSFTMKVFLGDALVRLYRVGLGEGGRTPATRFTVGEKIEHPTWWTPNGPIPYGHPDNVLGDYFVKFSHDRNQGFGIHGTKDTDSIGKERSQGCVRLLADDLKEFFSLVPVGSTVEVRE